MRTLLGRFRELLDYRKYKIAKYKTKVDGQSNEISVVTSLLRSLTINLLNINNIDNKTQARKLFVWSDIELLFLKKFDFKLPWFIS